MARLFLDKARISLPLLWMVETCLWERVPPRVNTTSLALSVQLFLTWDKQQMALIATLRRHQPLQHVLQCLKQLSVTGSPI